MKKTSKNKGFTLLEILLVVGIIAVLAGVVIVAINPSKTLATVRNSERKSDLKQIDSALSQYYIDNNEYPTSLTSVSDLTEICDTGTATSTADLNCGGLVDLTALVPKYLTAIPTDPSATTTSHAGYKIVRTGRRISLSAPAELGQTIARGATTYTVTYDGNGNTGGIVPFTQTKVENTTLALRDNSGTLVKTGYTFAGWNTLANGSGTDYAEGANYTTNAGVTLFAKWTADTYTVTFDTNGGNGGSTATQTLTYNTPTALASNGFTRTGYTFAGWATSASGVVAYADTASYTIGAANVTLFAKWTINTYTVTYDGNGNTGGTVPANKTKTYDVTLVLALNRGFLVKTGYTFAGWNTLANGSGTDYAEGANYTTNAGVTLFAKWTANTYTVTYNGNSNNGGTVPSNQTKTHDVTLVLASNSGSLVKTGYTFAGWNILANGSGTDYAQGANYTANAGVTLFAKWTDACSHVPTDPDCWSIAQNSYDWGPIGTVTGVQSTTTGAANTATLAGLTGTYAAADYCDALNESGYTDWYLPAKEELLIGRGALGLGSGGFPTYDYWSSTEFSNNSAWFLLNFNGSMEYTFKDLGFSIRCLR